MSWLAVRNLSRPLAAPLAARYCATFACRLRGLTFRRRLASGEALLLTQARDSRLDASIHMLFVWMDLGVVWINTAGQVVDKVHARAWRPAYLPARPANRVLELEPGRLAEFEIGDYVQFDRVET